MLQRTPVALLSLCARAGCREVLSPAKGLNSVLVDAQGTKV